MKIALLIPIIESDVVDEEVSMGIATTMLKNRGYEVLFTTLHENKENFEQLFEYRPLIVCIMAYSDTIRYVKMISKSLKQMYNSIKIVFVGYAATHHFKELVLDSSICDFSIIGEYEDALIELVDAITNNKDYCHIKGLAYRNQDKVLITEARDSFVDLDALPYSDRSILRQEKMKYAKIQGSKGCKMNCCSFCCETSFWGERKTTWKVRSPQNIVNEIETIMKQNHIYKFNFNDNNYFDPNHSSERVMEIADLIIKRELPITYFVNIRADFHRYISDTETQYMIKSGYRGALIGFESANQFDLNLYRKATTVEDNICAAKIFAKYGLGVDCGFININPYSTLENLRKNILFLHNFGYMSYFSNLSRLKLFKGTALFEKANNDKLLKESKEINVFDYDYYHPEMKEFALFLNDYFYKINNKYHIMHRVRYFGVYFIQDTLHLLNYFEKVCNDMRAVELLTECVNKVKIELKMFNEINFQWFNELISCVENGTLMNEAYKLSENIMSVDSILKYIERLNQIKFYGYRNIIRHNRHYAPIL